MKKEVINYLHDGQKIEVKMTIKEHGNQSVTISFSDPTDYARFLMLTNSFIPKQNIVSKIIT